MDYSCSLRNFYFFGETARSGNGAVSSINGLVAALDRRVDVAVVLRNFARDYQSLNAKPFAVLSRLRHEVSETEVELTDGQAARLLEANEHLVVAAMRDNPVAGGAQSCGGHDSSSLVLAASQGATMEKSFAPLPASTIAANNWVAWAPSGVGAPAEAAAS